MAALALLLTGCRSDGGFDYDHSALYISGTENNPVVKFVVEDTPASYAVTVQATEKVPSDVRMVMAIDREKVEEYNAINKTNYYPIPEGAVELTDQEVVMKEGSAISSAAVVKVLSTEAFEEGCTYMVPVTIKSVAGGLTDVMTGSRTIYLRISRVISFAAVNANSSASSNFIFDKPIPLSTFTYEMKIYPTGLANKGPQRYCALEQADESKALLLRFNENGKPWKTLDIVAPNGRYVTGATGEGDSAVGVFEPNQWYMISIVWNGSDMVVYVNGEKDTPWQYTIAGSQAFNLNRFEIGMSWGGYGGSQSYTGRMAEMRIWNIARSQSDIASTLCSVDATAEGLLGYWKMNEGQGHIFRDSVNGNDMDWDRSEREKNENGYLPTPEAGASVAWVKDAKNKCAQ